MGETLGVVRADPATYGELIDLAMARCAGMQRVELEPVLQDGFATLLGVVTVIEGGTTAGWGAAYLAPGHETWAGVRVVVARDHERRGIGTALHSALMATVPPGLEKLTTLVYDDDPESLAIARHWGWEVQQHSIRSSLPLDSPAPPELPSGVSLEHSLTLQFTDGPAVEAMLDRAQTNPERGAGVVVGFDQVRSWVAPGETLLTIVLRVDGEPAAICLGFLNGDVVYVGFTGVDPAFRGRGLARLAKQGLHRWGAALGARTALTANEEHNTGIRRINAAMGFVPQVGEYRLWRDA